MTESNSVLSSEASASHEVRLHARLSASRVERVYDCPGSLLLEEQMPEQPSSEVALRGTAIHELSEMMLLGKQLPVDADPELVAVAQGYVDAVRQHTDGCKELMVELDVTPHLTPIHESLGGTLDLGAKLPGKILLVCDLKTGRIPVSPENNKQLMTYAIGLLYKLGLYLGMLINVRLAIYQPEAGGWKEWDTTTDALSDWAFKLAELGRVSHQPNAPLNPSASACRFCRAKPICPAIRGKVMDAARSEFATPSGKVIPITLTKENIVSDCPTITANLLEDAEIAEMWATAVKEMAKNQLIVNPTSIAGWKLRDGRRMRSWADEKMVIELLKDHKEAFSLKSCSTIEKLGLAVPESLIKETRAAASLVREK